MTHNARIGAVLGALAVGSLSGCFSPGESRSGGEIDDTARRAALGITCEARVSITGSFVRGADQPADVKGCWPVGKWTFTASLEDSDCTSDIAMETEYSFDVARDTDENYVYTVNTNPTGRNRVKVTSGGSGLCEGGLEIFSADGTTVTNFKPQLNADGSIVGFGEHTVYTGNQWW